MLDNVREFLSGANKFYSQFTRRKDLNDCVWQEGNTQIISYSEENKALPTLVFIPSLINKSYILNLSVETSMIHYFVNQGYEVLLVNFIEIEDPDLELGFTEFIQRVKRAVSAVVINKKFITIGYCLGGVFSCAISSSHPVNLVGQILLATPWNFDSLKKFYSLDNEYTQYNLKQSLGNFRKISPTVVQWSLSFLSPEKIWQKFCDFSKMTDSSKIEKFNLVEQWVNDGLSLSNKFFFECLSILKNNDLQNEKYFSVNSKTPTLAFYGLEDKIVPQDSCIPLYSKFENIIIESIETGHIGLIISRNAINNMWPKITSWIQSLS